jgi:hypothetical protein
MENFVHWPRKNEILFTFVSGKRDKSVSMFTNDVEQELASWAPGPFRYIPFGSHAERPDIVVLTVHGVDLSRQLWKLRETLGEQVLVVVWLWDNHHSYIWNFRTAVAADIVFVCDGSHLAYLYNTTSSLATHISPFARLSFSQ